MTDVKSISASENFLSIVHDKKKCMDGVYEECKNRRLLRKLQQHFGCTPFGLCLAVEKEWVSFLVYTILIIDILCNFSTDQQ